MIDQARRQLRALRGRLNYALPRPLKFRGAYASAEEALARQKPRQLTGYDHPDVVDVSFTEMCNIHPWDYPILFWLERLKPQARVLIDAGGHMGTKYRAFRRLIDLPGGLDWIVYELPEMVRAGRARAQADGLPIHFEHEIAHLPAPDIVLASGLLQYFPEPLSTLLKGMKRLPPHLLLNKVALREGRTVVTMEDIGRSRVPYHIRERAGFLRDVEALGYVMQDEWRIPSFSHVIPTHPELGASTSAGFYFALRG